MPSFGQKSKERLAGCDQRLQDLFNEVIKTHDCTVIEGHRSRERQDYLYSIGRTKALWPQSKHNHYPAKAVDVMPYPIDWNDRKRLEEFADVVLMTAKRMKIDIKWGGHFKSFFDGPHFELN